MSALKTVVEVGLVTVVIAQTTSASALSPFVTRWSTVMLMLDGAPAVAVAWIPAS
ncbi:hypothetical protein ACWCQS_36655 [Streptomyces sp. NPDC002076]